MLLRRKHIIIISAQNTTFVDEHYLFSGYFVIMCNKKVIFKNFGMHIIVFMWNNAFLKARHAAVLIDLNLLAGIRKMHQMHQCVLYRWYPHRSRIPVAQLNGIFCLFKSNYTGLFSERSRNYEQNWHIKKWIY